MSNSNIQDNTEAVVAGVSTEAKQDTIITELSSLTSKSFPSDIEGGGQITVGTTPIEATFTGTTSSVIITADSANTGILYVGKSNVLSTGANSMTFLQAGDSITIDYDDTTNGLFVVSDTASQAFFKGASL